MIDPAAVAGPVQVSVTFDDISFTPSVRRNSQPGRGSAFAGWGKVAGEMDPSFINTDDRDEPIWSERVDEALSGSRKRGRR
jgi:hypothetical protein